MTARERGSVSSRAAGRHELMVTPTGIEPLTPTPMPSPIMGEGVKDGEGWKPHRMILPIPRS